jgi:hypothetical protein
MSRKVLVAVDLDSVSEASAFYGLQLAARTDCSLALLAVSASERSVNRGLSRALPGDLPNVHRVWLDRIVAQAQQRAVGLEIFVTSGRFFEEIMHFVRFATGLQFIIVAAPKEKGWNGPTSPLKRLHEEFEGEILLVEEAGRITRVSDRYLQM